MHRYTLLLGPENKEESRKHEHQGKEIEGHGNLGLQGHFLDVLLLEELDQVLAVHYGHFVVEAAPGLGQDFVFLQEAGHLVSEGVGEGCNQGIPEACHAYHVACLGRIQQGTEGDLPVCGKFHGGGVDLVEGL